MAGVNDDHDGRAGEGGEGDGVAGGEDDTPERSAVSDALGVPDAPPDPETDDHVLPDEKLRYPTLTFEEGAVDPEDGFDLAADLDRESARKLLDDLAGALASHDLVVEGPDTRATFGVGVDRVEADFTPDEDGRGEIEVTLTMPAKVLDYAPADADFVGARGGTGFIQRAMLTEERPPESFRCYNWIDEPAAGLKDTDDAPDE
ncbi:hypothetical protein JCM17823_25900 [Halorubrum gandharaense]